MAHIAFEKREETNIAAMAKHEVLVPGDNRQETEQLYDAMRRGKAKLVGPDGQARLLPHSLHSFLIELIGLLNEGKAVYIVQNQAKLTTVEAAAMLGVSRQFLVNILEKGEIPYHLVGTHRRIYAQDLLAFKSRRDQDRRRVLGHLAKEEAAEGSDSRCRRCGLTSTSTCWTLVCWCLCR
jgi:excisionase family DNA binding protein